MLMLILSQLFQCYMCCWFCLGYGASAVEIDIMQPLDENKSPKPHIPALNHIGKKTNIYYYIWLNHLHSNHNLSHVYIYIGLWVDDLPNAVEHLTTQGSLSRSLSLSLSLFTPLLSLLPYLNLTFIKNFYFEYILCYDRGTFCSWRHP